MRIPFIVLACLTFFSIRSQHTFSIVAVDPNTGEVGSAGASCFDHTNISDPEDIISELFPGKGAINCQAYFYPKNQENARKRMNLGDTPSEIIQWLINNDASNEPEYAQYGIASLINNAPKIASYSGTSIDTIYDRIIGTNYAIQGNTLISPDVLSSMEQGVINESRSCL